MITGLIVGIALLNGAFIASSYKAHFKPKLNEWGEYYDPNTDTWRLPNKIIPEIGLSERGEGITSWFRDAFDLKDEKKALRNYTLLAIILYTKPWK